MYVLSAEQKSGPGIGTAPEFTLGKSRILQGPPKTGRTEGSVHIHRQMPARVGASDGALGQLLLLFQESQKLAEQPMLRTKPNPSKLAVGCL